MFWALVVGQGRSGADVLSLYGAESPDGKGPRWARFLTFFASLVEVVCSGWLYFIVEVRVHISSPCGRSGEVRVRHAITVWSRVTGWQRAGVGTVSDLFRLLGRSCVFRLVVCTHHGKKGVFLAGRLRPKRQPSRFSSMASSSFQELAVLGSIVVAPRARARRLPHLRQQAATRARSPSC